jgi:hypothetical protein
MNRSKLDFWQTLDHLRETHPKIQVIEREQSPLMKFLAALLFFNPYFLDGYTTTIGHRVYMPKRSIGTASGADTLWHEAKHVEQYEKGGLWFMFAYIFLLPAIWTMRAKYEYEGYYETLVCIYHRRGRIPDYDLEWIASQFTGSAYLFMDPFPKRVMKKLLKMRNKITSEPRPL